MWQLEGELTARGIQRIAGVDEAGRGPLAGPVVAAAVIVPAGFVFQAKIDDSKKLSPAQREKAFLEIQSSCRHSAATVGEQEIDRENILKATLTAMSRAVAGLNPAPEWVLVDGPHLPALSCPGTAVIDGDAKSISIACASIIAKVVRDRLMIEYDRQYPQYGFARHKGYGTKAHYEALRIHGPCPLHRRSFFLGSALEI
ncbi:MAG: ribonuclease HII [Candidatus Omnitrophica bacterium]|nr:ribonuclease HII [Candidatus Omnitrophota bacterium]